jgi:hypothetical protein
LTIAFASDSNNVQNGPDGIRIVIKGTGLVIDGLAYEGVVDGTGEGDPAPGDPDDNASIGRCPNGSDTDDNATDFSVGSPATPGADNVCI